MESGAVHNDHDHLSDHNDRSADIFYDGYIYGPILDNHNPGLNYLVDRPVVDHSTRFLYDGCYDGTDDEFVFFD